MDLREIYRTVDTAEQTQDFLHDEALRYENYVEEFYSDEGLPVSRELLLDETRHLVNVLQNHEDVYNRLETAREDLKDVNGHRFMHGQQVDAQSLESRIDELIQQYDEHFEYAWSTGIEPHRDPSAPDPIHLKYRMWQKEQMEDPGDAMEKAMQGLEHIVLQ